MKGRDELKWQPENTAVGGQLAIGRLFQIIILFF